MERARIVSESPPRSSPQSPILQDEGIMLRVSHVYRHKENLFLKFFTFFQGQLRFQRLRTLQTR
jgi:hypothetical protein